MQSLLRGLQAASQLPHAPARSLVALPRGLATKTAGPQPRDPDRPRGDTDFVKRRRAYRQQMHEERVRLQKAGYEYPAGRSTGPARLSAATLAARAARAERKRVKSEARQEKAKELLAAVQAAKAERVAFRRRDWEARQRVLEAKRAADLQLLVDHAHAWVTEETLDEHVERAVDAFFIVQEKEEKEKVKVVGWS